MSSVPGAKERIWLLAAIAILGLLAWLWRAHVECPNTATKSGGSEALSSNPKSTEVTSRESKLPVPMPGSGVPTSVPMIPIRVVGRDAGVEIHSYGKALVEIDYVDGLTNRPVTSGTITIEPFYGPDLTAELNDEGKIFFEAEPGDYYLRSSCPEYYKKMENIAVPQASGNIQKIIRLSRSVFLRGIVKNADGKAQPEACITIVAGGESCISRSGNNGIFEAQLPAHNIDKIYAFRPPHAIAELGPLTLSESHNPFLEITLPEDYETVRLTGKVLDDQNRPVEDAWVELRAKSSYREQRPHILISMAERSYYDSIRTDAAGRFSVELLPQREVALTVRAENLEYYSETLDVLNDVHRDIRLKRDPLFKVKVQDIDGHLVSGLGVTAIAPSGRAVHFYSSEKGVYFASSYPFVIFAAGLNNNLGTTASAWIGSYRDEITLTLGQAQIAGRAMDEAGNPVKFIRVDFLLARADSYHCGGPMEFYSQDGSFVIRNLVAGKASLTITPGFSEQRKGLNEFQQDVAVTEGRTTFVPVIFKAK
ncbi:MAG: carboxypeptidase-like regulatory domain-containing protein [Acidobacteriia bacterium]|nr:carboxypeptidase-like regulatory domain-containing protein [Terriglobia bacterium]